jgi:hypothetical protein
LSEWFPFDRFNQKITRAAALPVATLAVPQADDIDFAGAEAQACFKQSTDCYLIGILVLMQGASSPSKTCRLTVLWQ